MATIKQLEAQLALASTARQRAELTAGIAFLRKQAAARRAAAPDTRNWVEKERDAALLHSGSR